MQLLMIFAILLSVLLPGVASATIVTGPRSEAIPAITLTEHRVEATIDGVVARTRITQVWSSSAPTPLEAFFIVPTPRDSQVTEFTMTVDGQTLTAEVMDAGEARRIYESIVRRTRDPGLLEYVDARTLRLRVFPIPARGHATLELEYLETLKREGQLTAYRFQSPETTARLQKGSATLKIALKSTENLGTIFSPTPGATVARAADGRSASVLMSNYTDIQERFTLYFDSGRKDVGLAAILDRGSTGNGGTAMLIVTPPNPSEDRVALAKDVLFVFDTSGSMSDEGKMGKMIAALQQCLAGLNAADRFNMVQFATGTKLFSPDFAAADQTSIENAKAWLAEQRPRGGTNISGALAEAASQLAALPADDARIRQVIFMTDGLPTVGDTDDVQILEKLKPASGARPRVFTVGFGTDVNTHLLDTIAENSAAVPTYVDPKQDIELAVGALFEAISHPAMTDIQIETKGFELEDRYPAELPDLFHGRDLLVLGRYTGTGTASVTLKGRAGERTIDETIKLELPTAATAGTAYVRAIWAQRRVGYLLDQIRRNGESKEVREEVIALAMEYRLVTPYTSFIAAPDAEYALATGAPAPAAPTRYRRLMTFDSPHQEPSSEVVSRDGLASSQEGYFDKSGAGAVRAAEEVQSFKQAQAAAAPERSEALRSDGSAIAYAGRKSFNRARDTAPWIEAGTETAKPIAIKYLSAAYYELLAAYPEHRDAILLGEQVRLAIGSHVVEIGETGAEAELPLELKID